jgi:hypothetical protein
MKEIIKFLPALALVFMIVWVTVVHRRCLNRLRKVYRDGGIQFEFPTGMSTLNAWSVFQPASADTEHILAEKEKLRAEAKRQLRYCFPIFFLAFFGLAVLSGILKHFVS